MKKYKFNQILFISSHRATDLNDVDSIADVMIMKN